MRSALAGCGYVATREHLPFLAKYSHLSALCDSDEDRARQAARDFSVPNFYSSFEKMIQSEPLDLVDICTPPSTHAELINLSLNHGINCLVEKPLTVGSAKADEVIRLSREKGLKLFVIHNFSFAPVILKAKSIVARGKLGTLLGVEIKYLRQKRYIDSMYGSQEHWSHKLPGGIFGEILPHVVMMLFDFVNDYSKVISASTKTSDRQYNEPEDLMVTVQSNRMLGSFWASTNAPLSITTIDLLGTLGYLHVNFDLETTIFYPLSNDRGKKYLFYKGARSWYELLLRLKGLTLTTLGSVARRYSAHEYLIREAIRALKDGTPYPVDLQKSRQVVELIEQIFPASV